jgi:hypothetical protein
MRAASSITACLVLVVVSVGVAFAAPPYFASSFRIHDADEAILRLLGYTNTSASLLYFREAASITEEQARQRRQYEPIGCHPFYVMLNGKADELGYNCRSFYCVGYLKGPKQCQDVRGKAYGGVSEISRRLGLVTIQDIRKPYKDYAAADRTSAMSKRIAELEKVACDPFFLQEFDVVVGDGFQCKEIGKYPQFSGEFSCVLDTRNKEGVECTLELRDNEMELRERIVGPQSSSSASSGSGTTAVPVSENSSDSSISSSSQASSSSLLAVTFPDIEQGKYGYTAIVALAARGIIKGYPDGTFRPKNVVNRAEFVHLLALGVHPDQVRKEGDCFPDVTRQWFSATTCAARRLKWVSGYADGKFHPERTMRRSEAIKVIVASMGQPLDSSTALPLGVPTDAWYTPYIRKAVELGIILEPAFVPEGEVTRADAAVWMYRSAKLLKRL